MLTILNLFGRSPFAPLQSHMQKVADCVYMLPDLFDALEKKEYDKLAKIADKISELEHHADITKNDIRNHLPRSLFLPIDRGNLLDILTLQDRIADTAEDIGVIASIKEIEILDELKGDFKDFLAKNIETFNGVQKIIKEMHELLESSFGGIEAEKVRKMVDDVAYKENQVDLIQRKLLKTILHAENKMTYTTFYAWQQIFISLAMISNLSEKLAYRVRTTLELK